MNRFLPESHFIRYFPPQEHFSLLTVGYDDFSVVKPLKTFRVQTFYTWHFVLSGSGMLEMGGIAYPITAGQMFFIPPGIQMRYYPNPDTPWEYVWFSLKGEAAAQYGELLGFRQDSPVQGNSFAVKAERILSQLFSQLQEDSGGYFSALSAFYGLMNLCTSNPEKTGIESIKKVIDESFALSTFSIEQLCRDAGISHPHLLRLFKERYGTTIVKYLQKKRLDYACELLLTSDISVKSVAYSCGFSDEIHFMKTFKKEMGISALQFRKHGKPSKQNID